MQVFYIIISITIIILWNKIPENLMH